MLEEKNEKNSLQELEGATTTSTTQRRHLDLIPSHKMAMKLAPGFTWNPLRTLPRNQLCPCRSGKKFKRCCLDTLPIAVPEKHAEIFLEQMSKPDLVFVTNENKERILAEAEAKKAIAEVNEKLRGE